MSLAYSVPPEVWLAIFANVVDAADLHALTLTCRYFHPLANGLLYTSIRWKLSANIIHSVAFVSMDTNVQRAVRSLVIEQSPKDPPVIHNEPESFDNHGMVFPMAIIPPHLTQQLPVQFLTHIAALQQALPNPLPHAQVGNHAFIDSDDEADSDTDIDVDEAGGTETDDDMDILNAVDPISNEVLIAGTLSAVRFFVSLRSLILVGMNLPVEVYQIIHSLQQLRNLVLRSCTCPRQHQHHQSMFDTTTLPLTCLTLRDLVGSDNTRHALTDVCNLAHAAGLRILRVDLIGSHVLSSIMDNHITCGITTLSTKIGASFETHDFRVLRAFLELTPSVRYLTVNDVPKTAVLPAEAAVNLVSLESTMLAVRLFARGRALEHVRVIERPASVNVMTHHQEVPATPSLGSSMKDVIELMEFLQSENVPMTSLQLVVESWHIEIMYMLSQLWGGLRHLRLGFGIGAPDEDFLVSFGAIWGSYFPALETLHLFNVHSRSVSDPADVYEETRHHIIQWEKSLPSLREVVLSGDVRWTKFAEHDWKRKADDVASGYLLKARRRLSVL